MTDELPLTGGNSNAPVRIGDRVHRLAGPWSTSVHAYLRHVRAAGVHEVPEPFGFDARGREVLSFLPGDVPAYPLPDAAWTDGVLVDAARLLRRLHDASVDLDRVGRIWQQPAREPAEVIALNDYAPYNLVLRAGRVAGVIDVDQAAPGPRVRDLAHLAYRLVALTAPENRDVRPQTHQDRTRRLHMLVQAYGGPDALETVSALPALLADVAAHADAAGRPDHGDLYRRDREWVMLEAAAIAAASST